MEDLVLQMAVVMVDLFLSDTTYKMFLPVIGIFHIKYPVIENAIPNAHIGFKNGTIAFAFLVTC